MSDTGETSSMINATLVKGVLEYTEEELRSLPTEDLERLLAESSKGESLFGTRQLVEKTIIKNEFGEFYLYNEV